MCTVFSAPNYCGIYQNKGAVLALNRKNIAMKTFDARPSPYYYGPVDGRGDFLLEGLTHISHTVLLLFQSVVSKAVTVGRKAEETKEASQSSKYDEIFNFGDSSDDEEPPTVDVVQLLEE